MIERVVSLVYASQIRRRRQRAAGPGVDVCGCELVPCMVEPFPCVDPSGCYGRGYARSMVCYRRRSRQPDHVTASVASFTISLTHWGQLYRSLAAVRSKAAAPETGHSIKFERDPTGDPTLSGHLDTSCRPELPTFHGFAVTGCRTGHQSPGQGTAPTRRERGRRVGSR